MKWSMRHVHLAFPGGGVQTVDVKAGEVVVIGPVPELDGGLGVSAIYQSRELLNKVDRPFLQLQAPLKAKIREALKSWEEASEGNIYASFDIKERLREALAMVEDM